MLFNNSCMAQGILQPNQIPKVYDFIQENTGSIVVVVCPLIAVMKDQVTCFRNLGLSAAYVGEKTVEKRIISYWSNTNGIN